MEEYTVIYNQSLVALISEVNHAISRGFKPVGGISVCEIMLPTIDGRGNVLEAKPQTAYHQAMVK